MRGLPGAGKSTRAAQLAEAAESAAVAAALDSAAAAAAAAPASAAVVAIHSTDSYFIDAAGVYRFNAELLGLNHQRNYDAFCASLTAGVSTVILDNTNLQVGTSPCALMNTVAGHLRTFDSCLAHTLKRCLQEQLTRQATTSR
jgi:hypothetical protein